MAANSLSGSEAVKPVRGIEFLSRQLVEGFITGLHKSPYHGFSVEFAEHRLYNPGQSTKHVDWKVFARTDRLFTKQFEEETNLRCMLLLDVSKSMHYPLPNHGKLKFSIQSAGALAWLLHRQRDASGVCAFDDKIRALTPVKSTRTGLDKLYAVLDQYSNNEMPVGGTTNATAVLHEIAEKVHRRSLIIIFSDLFETSADLSEVFKALQHLKHNKHEVLLFHVFDGATEDEFEFAGRPHEFTDLETGEKIRLNPAEVREGIRERLIELHREVSIRCHELRIDLIRSDIRKGFESVLEAYLLKRARMH
ncbi:MAG: DUF58 domain-containing protein [Cyclobacteriaceae bacterium]